MIKCRKQRRAVHVILKLSKATGIINQAMKPTLIQKHSRIHLKKALPKPFLSHEREMKVEQQIYLTNIYISNKIVKFNKVIGIINEAMKPTQFKSPKPVLTCGS